MKVKLDTRSIESYRQFLQIKQLPAWSIRGRIATFPDEYASQIIGETVAARHVNWEPSDFLFDYQKDITRLAIRKRKYAVFADCMAGETVINSPNGDITIAEAFERGVRPRVYAIERGAVVIALAGIPFINGIDELYRYQFASGRSIIATKRHRFLSLSGWIPGDEVRIGERLAVSDASHLRSISGHDPLIPFVSDLHSTKTTQDYGLHYSACCRQCDARLPLRSNSVSSATPLRGDVHEHSQMMSQMGAMGNVSARSRQNRSGRHHSIGHCDSPVANAEAIAEFLLLACGPERIDESNCILQQAPGGTTPHVKASVFHPLEEQRSLGVPFDDSIEFDTLVAVQYIRTDVFYDMEVPGPANFLANGTWSHNCGLGKTLIMLEFAQAALDNVRHRNKGMLIVSPLMVCEQTAKECQRWYGFAPEQVRAAGLQDWLDTCGDKIGITNYEAISQTLRPGRLGGLCLDESSMLKSHYGKWGKRLIGLGRGLDWKLCLTGTPAPNDRIEYANHAVFLDTTPTVNSFLATYFINRGQTSERWAMKDHAISAFYRALSHWAIFLTDPSTYGWRDNTTSSIPPVHVTIHDVLLTAEQKQLVAKIDNSLFVTSLGGISRRAAYGQIAKGFWKQKQIDTNKPKYIRELIDKWNGNESTLVWCIYNEEQSRLARELPGCASITGSTKVDRRHEIIDAFKQGEIKTLVTKPRILGFGLNLEVATRQVFSGLQDSYESYYQAVKRSNRIGSTRPLNVHIPITDIEEPMVQNVLRKAAAVQQDTERQEKIFKENALCQGYS